MPWTVFGLPRRTAAQFCHSHLFASRRVDKQYMRTAVVRPPQAGRLTCIGPAFLSSPCPRPSLSMAAAPNLYINLRLNAPVWTHASCRPAVYEPDGQGATGGAAAKPLPQLAVHPGLLLPAPAGAHQPTGRSHQIETQLRHACRTRQQLLHRSVQPCIRVRVHRHSHLGLSGFIR